MTGCLMCVLSGIGMSQLATAATPTSGRSVDEYPVLKPVWDFFAPETGVVEVAKVEYVVPRNLWRTSLGISCLHNGDGRTFICFPVNDALPIDIPSTTNRKGNQEFLIPLNFEAEKSISIWFDKETQFGKWIRSDLE